MTNQTPESVIAEVIEHHADTIGTHYDGCHKHHAVCLAVKLRDMLLEPGVPDAALAAIERVRAVVKSIRFLAALPPFDEGNTVMNAAADDIVVAIDGAPEPEWEERLAACDKHGTHCWSCTRHTERRRPAGEWHRLPVEGESKP